MSKTSHVHPSTRPTAHPGIRAEHTDANISDEEDGDVGAFVRSLEQRGYQKKGKSSRVDPMTVELWGDAISAAIRGDRRLLCAKLHRGYEVTWDLAEFLAILLSEKKGGRLSIPRKFRELTKFDHPLFPLMVMLQIERSEWKRDHPHERRNLESFVEAIAADFDDYVKERPKARGKGRKSRRKVAEQDHSTFNRLLTEARRSRKAPRRLLP